MKSFLLTLFFIVMSLSMSNSMFSQEETKSDKVIYSTELDRLLTMKSIAFFPFFDNVKGIYAEPVANHLKQWFQDNHHWDLIPFDLVGPSISIEELQAKPDQVRNLVKGSNADAFLMGKIIKTPNDIFLKFALFLKKDGKMISYVEKKDLNIFELSKVIEESHSLVMSLLDKLPYRGRILSRTDNRVTVNLGTKDGVKTNQILTVTQVIRLIRHPKFHFIVSAEKEIIGKIKLVQVNETLSFAKIISEKEYGAIQRDAKISGIKFVYYADEDDGFGGKKSLVDVIKKRTDSEVAFGADPKAWVPQKPPTFGKISGTFQFGNFEYARSSSSKSYKSDNYFPGVDINIEIWLTPKWSLHGLLGFGIGNLENPLSGSNPDSLSTNYSHYEMLLGYNIRMGDSIWGSKLEVMFGLTQSKYNLDSSLPISLTTSEYRGGVLGFYAHHPLKVWANTFVGGNLFYTVFPEVKEYPSNSGYGKNIDSFRFSIFGFKKVNEHFQYDAGIRFLMHANKYDKESTAKNLSVKYTSAFIGASYLF